MPHSRIFATTPAPNPAPEINPVAPAANGTFLSGITRHRVISLLDEAGFDVRQTSLKVSDFEEADEIFATGNMMKVMPITKFETRDLQPGPVAAKARELYWQYAHAVAG